MNDETTTNPAQTGGTTSASGAEGRIQTPAAQSTVPRPPAVIATLGILTVAVAALMAAAALALNLRYVATGGGDGGPVIDTWTRTVTLVEGGFASTVPMAFNDSRTVPGGLLWGDFDDVPFRTELQYTNGRMYYEFATEDLSPSIRDAMSFGREITFLLTSRSGVPLVVIEENFASAVRLVDTETDSQEPVGISFSGRVDVDGGTWDAIAGVRTQFR